LLFDGARESEGGGEDATDESTGSARGASGGSGGPSPSGVVSVALDSAISELVRDMEELDVALLEERDFFDKEWRLEDFRFAFFSGVDRATLSDVSGDAVAAEVVVKDKIELRDKRAREEE